MRIARLWATLAVLVSMMAVGIGATPVSAAAVATQFNATLSGHAAISGLGSFSFDGAGTATDMGPITNHGVANVTGVSLSCAAGLANTHVETLTDSTASSLTLTSTDVGCPVGPLQFDGTGTWVFTSGTGRFAHVSGYGSATGHADFLAGTFRFTLTGTIIFN